MIDQFVAVLFGDRPLQFLDIPADELCHLAGLQTHHVIVMRPMIEFVNGMTALEIMPVHQTGCLELRQNPVHGCKTDIITVFLQLAINLFGAKMALLIFLKQVKNFSARARGF